MLTSLLILSAGQGFFLGLLLLGRRVNTAANKVLALVMFVSSIFLLYGVFYRGGHYFEYPHLVGFGQPLVFLFGPTLYLYAVLVSTGERSFKPIWLLHFLPYVLNVLYFIPFILSSADVKLATVDLVMHDQTPIDIRIIESLKYPHGIIYATLSVILLRRHRRGLKDQFSSIERINLNWLRYLTIGIVAVWSFATLEYLFGLVGFRATDMGDLTQFAVALFVYAIGYLGLRQPEIFGGMRTPTPALGVAVLDATDYAAPEPEGTDRQDGNGEVLGSPGNKYRKSGLTQDRADAILERLLDMMEGQKPFSRSSLTLQELSEELQVSAHNLSEVINTRLGKNFFDFVNGFRVQEVKRRLADPANNHLTILSIAQDAGFNSKSAFNTIFRKLTDTTPSEYRRQAQQPS